MIRVGVDVGGTFTDLILVDGDPLADIRAGETHGAALLRMQSGHEVMARVVDSHGATAGVLVVASRAKDNEVRQTAIGALIAGCGS